MVSALEALAEAVQSERDTFLKLIDPFIVPIVARRDLLFMRELSWAVGFHDPLIITDLAFGLPAIGWAPHAPTMPIRYAPPPINRNLRHDG